MGTKIRVCLSWQNICCPSKISTHTSQFMSSKIPPPPAPPYSNFYPHCKMITIHNMRRNFYSYLWKFIHMHKLSTTAMRKICLVHIFLKQWVWTLQFVCRLTFRNIWYWQLYKPMRIETKFSNYKAHKLSISDTICFRNKKMLRFFISMHKAFSCLGFWWSWVGLSFRHCKMLGYYHLGSIFCRRVDFRSIDSTTFFGSLDLPTCCNFWGWASWKKQRAAAAPRR